MTPVSAISPTPTRSEDTFLFGDCRLYFSAGSLDAHHCSLSIGNKTFQNVCEITVVKAFHSLTDHTLEQEPFLLSW